VAQNVFTGVTDLRYLVFECFFLDKLTVTCSLYVAGMKHLQMKYMFSSHDMFMSTAVLCATDPAGNISSVRCHHYSFCVSFKVWLS